MGLTVGLTVFAGLRLVPYPNPGWKTEQEFAMDYMERSNGRAHAERVKSCGDRLRRLAKPCKAALTPAQWGEMRDALSLLAEESRALLDMFAEDEREFDDGCDEGWKTDMDIVRGC